MIEKTVYDYLSAYFAEDEIPVYLSIPESLPNPSDSGDFIVIEKTGSSMENWIFHSTLAIQSYGATVFDACSLNERVKKAMFDILEEDEVTSVSLNSDYNFTDEETKRPRYQAVFDLCHFYKDE